MGTDTSVESPENRSLSDDIFIVPNEVDFLPNIAKEPIFLSLAQVISSIKPIRTENTDIKVQDSAFFVGIQSVDKRSAIVPFKVVKKLTELVLDNVEIAGIRPVVPEINFLESATVVHEENRVELRRPC